MVTCATKMTPEEWNELIVLKNAINYNPASVHFEKMKRFTELMVKSLEGKGEYCNHQSPSNY
jgi:hypothetical protein